MTKERPILFSGPMVAAILSGAKTQTRRVMRNQPIVAYRMGRVEQFCSTGYPLDSRGYTREQLAAFCPYGKPGDRLWVRETFMNTRPSRKEIDNVIYRAAFGVSKPLDPWSSSIHMPRWASRITLEITNVRVERLQEIPFYDIRAEGLKCPTHDFDSGFCSSECADLRQAWAAGWDALNAKRGYSWDSNPWVWVIEFKKL